MGSVLSHANLEVFVNVNAPIVAIHHFLLLVIILYTADD